MNRATTIASQLIDKYCLKSHHELDLEEIANAEKLIIEESKLNGLLGKILFADDCGFILINQGITNEGLKRFTIAHEMGHYFLSRSSQMKKHGCTYDSLGNYSSDKNEEAEANQFAAELLMHKPWFSKVIKNVPVCMDLIKMISAEFRVSITAAAVRYANIGQFPIAVIMSSNNKVEWNYINEYFPCKYLPKGNKVPEESCAWDYFNVNELSTDDNLIAAKAWFKEDFRCKSSTYLYEQSISIPATNSVLTILWESEFK